MSKSTTVDVYVNLPHGIILGGTGCPTPQGDVGFACDSSDRVCLEHGVNENVSREAIERWLAKNKTLAAVKRGDIRIIEGDEIAVDSSRK